jgi:hypothetical protein
VRRDILLSAGGPHIALKREGNLSYEFFVPPESWPGKRFYDGVYQQFPDIVKFWYGPFGPEHLYKPRSMRPCPCATSMPLYTYAAPIGPTSPVVSQRSQVGQTGPASWLLDLSPSPYQLSLTLLRRF